MVRVRGCGNVVTDHQMVVRWHLRHQSTPFNTICAPYRINLVAPTSKGMGRWMVVQKGAVQPPPNEGMGRWVVVQKGACSPPQHLPDQLAPGGGSTPNTSTARGPWQAHA